MVDRYVKGGFIDALNISITSEIKVSSRKAFNMSIYMNHLDEDHMKLYEKLLNGNILFQSQTHQ